MLTVNEFRQSHGRSTSGRFALEVSALFSAELQRAPINIEAAPITNKVFVTR